MSSQSTNTSSEIKQVCLIARVLNSETQLRAKLWSYQHLTIAYILPSILKRGNCTKTSFASGERDQDQRFALLQLQQHRQTDPCKVIFTSNLQHRRWFLILHLCGVQLINGLTVTAVTHAKLALERDEGFFCLHNDSRTQF